MSTADGAARAEAAEFIRREMQDGFLHPGIVAPGSRAHKALSTLVTAALELGSQPVEVTNAMVEAGARAIGEFVTHAPVRDLESPNGNYWVREARTVLRAALNTMKGDNS